MHILQPKHTKLSQKEKEKLLLDHNLSIIQLPKISIKDPALSEDFEKGDVVKIERKGDYAETYYRVVI
jgi:DNA-directed RNA polymerase subunit H (RpoH/RPB5)